MSTFRRPRMSLSGTSTRNRSGAQKNRGPRTAPLQSKSVRPDNNEINVAGRLRISGATVLGVVFFSLASAFAAESKGAGSTLFPFLKIPMSARATAMGGALGASADDVAMLEANPAGLMGIERVDLQATYLSYFEDSSLQSFSAGFPFRLTPDYKKADPGENEFYRNRFGVGFEYRQFKAEDQGYSANDIPEGEFSVRDQLMHVGLSYAFHQRLSVGVGAKNVTGQIQGEKTSVSAFDLGAIGRLSERWGVGLAVQNFGSGKKYGGSLDSAEHALPMTLRASVSFNLRKWLAVADIAQGRDKVTRKSGGVEWSANRFLRFRGGLFHTDTVEFTGGLGVDIFGPQKSIRRETIQYSSAKGPATKTVSAMAQELLGRSVDKLVDSYKRIDSPLEKPSLSVLSFTSKDQAGSAAQVVVRRKFAEKGDFKIVGDELGRDFIVSGNVDRVDDRYTITMRLIRMEDGETMGTNRTEIAVEDFYDRSAATGSTTLGTISDEPRKSDPKAGYVNLGLDYGMATNKNLGITHTVTFKILY
jgi:TolB-like protein